MARTPATGRRLDGRVVWYVAREAVRRYGPIEPRLPEKLQRNIRRTFHTTVPREDILCLAEHYKGVYAFARTILKQFLRPSGGKYADLADVRVAAFVAALRRRYSKEAGAVLEMIAWYTVFYEYLK